MPDLSDGVNWSEIDSNNNNAPPNGWPEGMMPSGVNDAARADRGALKRFWDKINPMQVITPSGNLWTFTTDNPAYPTGYVGGEMYCFRPVSAALGGDQFQVNGLGPKIVLKRTPIATNLWVPVIARDWRGGLPAHLVYDPTLNAGAGAFILTNPYVPLFGTGDADGSVSILGSLAVGGGLAVNGGDLTLGRTDQAYGWVIRPVAYPNLAFGAAGGTPLSDVMVVTNTMTVTGAVSATGYKSRSGINGPSQANNFNVQWTGSQAHLWIDAADLGPIVIGSAGNVVIGGNISAGSITASGNVSAGSISTTGSITGASLSTTGDITASGNLHQNGNYHYFAGSGGVVNGAGGPLIYGDANVIILKPGNGTIGFGVQNYAGTNVFTVNNSGDGNFTRNVGVNGQLTVTGQANVGSISTPGAASIGGVTVTTGGVNIQGGLFVANSTTTLVGTVFLNNAGGSNLLSTAGGNVNITGGLIVTTGGISVSAGGINANGGLFVNGTVTLNGTTFAQTINPTTNNLYSLGVSGNAWFQVTAYAFPNASDPALKRDIAPVPAGCLDLVRTVTPQTFRWKSAPEGEENRVHWGFMAPEIAQAMDRAGHQFDAARVHDNGLMTLEYNDLIAVLWAAVRELSDKLEAKG